MAVRSSSGTDKSNLSGAGGMGWELPAPFTSLADMVIDGGGWLVIIGQLAGHVHIWVRLRISSLSIIMLNVIIDFHTHVVPPGKDLPPSGAK